jgi:hypothetical protein
MAKSKSPIPESDAESPRPESDYEHQQRFLYDIDRSTWRGVHPPSHPGPRGIVHKLAVASNVPHIFQSK